MNTLQSVADTLLESRRLRGVGENYLTVLEAMLAVINRAFADWPSVALSLFAGVRTAEALRLIWQDVDFDFKTVNVPAAKAKTRARRVCPLTANCAAWLVKVFVGFNKYLDKNTTELPTKAALTPVSYGVTDSDKSQCQSSFIFPGTRAAFHSALRLALRRAGVLPRRNGLRHSFVSYRLALTGNAAGTALEAGHSEGMLFRNYRELVTSQAAREFFEIWPDSGQMHLPLAA